MNNKAIVSQKDRRICVHDWRWIGGGIDDTDFKGQMYCKKECMKCHLKKEIRE